jgi:hypothetical protein
MGNARKRGQREESVLQIGSTKTGATRCVDMSDELSIAETP